MDSLTQDATLEDSQPQSQPRHDALTQDATPDIQLEPTQPEMETDDHTQTQPQESPATDFQPTQPLKVETDDQTQNQASEPPSHSPLDTKPTKVKAAPQHPKRDPGKSLLPLARVQRIMKADRQLPACAKEAAVLISIAAEEFIKRLIESGHSQALREKRTTIQQKDLAVVVKRQDELLFLEEIIPTPTPSAPKPRVPRAPAPVTGSIADAWNLKRGGTSTTLPPADAWGRIPLPPRNTMDTNAPPPQPAPQASANMDTT